MKRYITLALCALTVFGLGSCNKVHEEDIDSPIRTVTFQAQLGGDTRTGLALKFVPDWRETNLPDVHIYEINGDERIEGEDVEMDIPGASEGNYEIALFKADFSNMTIIVNPPSNNAPRTRANEVYQYTSIVAPQDGNKKFTVPATQYPVPSTLIDPHADFIVGSSLQEFSDTQAGKQVNLKFVRPVAISRLSIMNVEDATIKQVKIHSSDKLTGSATYDDVNFEDGTVAFDNSGSNVLTLDYGTGVAMPAEGIFNAYFVSLTGTKRITKIEVITNAQTLTKEFAGGKALTFKVPDFKSIAVNMAGSGSSEPGPGDPLPQNISFTKAGSAIETDSFDLYTGDTYVSPTVSGAAPGATLTYESSDEAVATVSAAGVVTPKGVGETTISVVASAVEGYLAGNAEYVLTVTDSTPDPEDQPLKFMKGGSEISEDTYDLYNGGTYESPALTGAVEGATVTWEISCTPEGCATMTAEGVVTPLAKGVAVVTATASAVAPLYKETTLSYMLTIKDTTPASTQTKTYYLAESLEDGEEYVVVSGNNAMTVDGTSLGVKAITISSNTFEASEGEVALWTAAEHVEYYSGTSAAGHFTLSNGGQYLQRNSNGATQTGAIGEIPGTKKYYVWDYDGEHLYQISSASNTFYLTYDGGWKFEYSSQPNTYLYSAKAPRQAQEIAFSASAAEYDLYSESWTVAVPDLIGAQGTVTYSSSDEAVAQVNSTGAVTIPSTAKKGDTAIITASAAGNETYKAGEASYTITIVNHNPNVSRYNKVTSAGDLEVGAKYLIVFEGLSGDTDGDGDPKVFNPVLNDAGTQFAKATSSAMDVTITSGAIESSDVSDYEFTLESGYYLKADRAAKYIYPGTSGSSSVLLAESPASHALAITFNNGIAQISNGSGNNVRYIVWSTSSHYFSSNQQVSGSYSTGICLYKLDDGRQAQEISFSAADAEYDLGTSTWTKAVPTLTGAQGTVTYTSSDETVATVANDGTVTPLKKGTTTITASAAGNETFKPGEASYELTVINSNVPKYVKAEAIEAGQSYLIVSNGYLLRNESGTATPVAVEVNDGEILFDAASTDLWAATASGTSFNLTNSGQTLRRSSSNLQIGNASGTESNNQWTYDAANDHLMVSGNYYLYYSTGNSRFSISTTASSSHIAALYVLDDGRQAQEIAFGAADAEYDLGTSHWTKATPALTGAKTTVTYASSDETVATVANDGTVTPLKVGTTTITATASADAQYKKATASYTLSVVNSAVVEKTYNRVSSISAGTYLIMGRETSSGRAGTYVCVFPPSADNKCDHIKVSDNQDLATLTTTSNEYVAYEVELIASGSNWLVKVKSSGQYMYYASSKISFTDDASVAAQQITSNAGYPACIKNTNNDQFYHSGSNTCFMYSNNKNANNLRFFKLSE